jgi:hypothetical protein
VITRTNESAGWIHSCRAAWLYSTSTAYSGAKTSDQKEAQEVLDRFPCFVTAIAIAGNGLSLSPGPCGV